MTRGRIVVSGMMFACPVAGVVYQIVHYMLGFRRLGFDVWYVEDHDDWTLDPRTGAMTDDPLVSAAPVTALLGSVGLGDRWAYRRRTTGDVPSGCWGLDDATVLDLYRTCDAWINVTGTAHVGPDVGECRRRILVETDPVGTQIDVANGHEPTIRHLDAHDTHCTFGEVMVRGDGPIPLGPYRWIPTRQPVAVDLWDGDPPRHDRFTTVTSWHDEWRDRTLDGITYRWSKDVEFRRIVDVATRRPGRFELAVTRGVDGDLAHLTAAGWRVGDALRLSADPGDYRSFITGSFGEVTAAREQYVRPRSGWFSDRSASYLAAGRPVITQETGFSEILPTGLGLHAWVDQDDIVEAIDRIDADPAAAGRDARDIAETYFRAETVVGDLVDRVAL